ncbi:MAG: hypothetical protein ACYTFW_11105 [Planctomycetota bacterium]|jgi:hypothetical protein
MRRFILHGVIIFLIGLFASNPALGKPGYSVNCGKSGCHTTGRNGFTITDHDTMTNLGDSNLKTFVVEPGQTVILGTSVTDGHNRYAVVLQDFEHGGIEDSSHTLSFSTSSGWRDYTGDNPPYYSSSSSGHSWSGSTTQRNFSMTVDESTPSDFYRLQFELAGENGGKWSQREDFYLHVIGGTPKAGDGDIDEDGDVDFYDLVLLASKWNLQICDVNNDFCGGSDIDVDGKVGFNDVMELSTRWLMKKPLAISVTDGNDDAEESIADSGMSLGSSDLELISDGTGNDQFVGIRFNNVNIAPTTYIANAYIQFTVDEIDSGVCSLTIRGQASDDASAFIEAASNISSRPTTVASVAWSPPPWNTIGQASIDQQTPNLTAIIEEITARSGWSPGNSMVFIISGAGERTAESYNGVNSAAPVLHIAFDELPDAAIMPDPPDAAVGISTEVILSWLPGSGAASHEVYFGTDDPPQFQTSQVPTVFDPGPLAPGTTYYWKVDQVNLTGTTGGTIWSFTTSDIR